MKGRATLSALRGHWLTALVVFIAVVLVLIAVAEGFNTDESAASRAALPLFNGAAAAALLGGLWLLRSRGPTPLAHVLIVIGVLWPGIVFFWFFFIPSALALVVIWFGIVRGGLAHELRPG